jgi:transposase
MKTAQEILLEKLEKENIILEKALAEKKNEVEVLAVKNSSLETKADALGSKADALELEAGKLKITVENLKFQIAQLKRMIFGSKRERFESNEHSGQLKLVFDIEEAILEEAIDSEKEKISYERDKVKKSHPGREALPSHLPVVEIMLEPSEDVSRMTCIGNEITEELEYTPAKLYINRYIRPKYITKEDEAGDQRQVIAPLDRPMPKCIAGPDLLANIITSKYVYHLPIYRQLQRFKQEAVHIKSSTMDSWLNLTAKHVRPLFAVHKAYILESNYLQVDESPIKVLDRDKPGATHQGYMWVYHSVMQKAVFFDYNRGRGQTAPLENLSDFSGFLQTDGYAVYDQFGIKEDIIHLSCWAHARRYFDKAKDNDLARASFVLNLIQKLYAVERFAREQELTPEQRKEHRLAESLTILNEIGKFIADNRNKVLPRSPIGKAFEYCTHRWDNLQNFLLDGNLEIDSNLIENAIRPLALGRKNYLFAGSHDAAENIAMYYSFFATCKKHDINPEKWFAYIIRNINHTRTIDLKNLLPQFIDKSLVE